jgi:hypothetical protein
MHPDVSIQLIRILITLATAFLTDSASATSALRNLEHTDIHTDLFPRVPWPNWNIEVLSPLLA